MEDQIPNVNSNNKPQKWAGKSGGKMKYFKRKDGSVFGKQNPSKEMIDQYKKDGCKPCDENGKVKSQPKKKK